MNDAADAPLVLRPARDGDAAGFIALIGACWAEYPGCVLDVDGEGLFLVAVDDGGDAAFATQHTGGSLASPFARLGRQRKLFAHVHVSKNWWFKAPPLTPPGMTMNGEARL